MMTLRELRARQGAETETLLREALDASGWVITRAAERLGCTRQAILRLVATRPALAAELRRRGRGPGRPSQVRENPRE
jgi:plasmid maintenance system antidote protein VapI